MTCPFFSLPGSDGKTYTLHDFSTPFVLFFFYPKDNTPGCTIENKDFSFLKTEFEKKGITLVGVSPDSLVSHEKFTKDHELSVLLLSDPEKQFIQQMGAWGEKKNYGKTYEGLIRSTFLVNTATKEIEKTWKNVKAAGHAEKILKEIL